MWRYNNYLTVSEDFIPVFSEDVDRNRKDNWKFFIPHTYMKEILQKLIIALERGHDGDKLSLWLTGAYGTGKTYASFVVKHLLEDPLEDVENYLLKHEMVSSLWPRFKALRSKKPYLVIYRSSSGQITTNRRLMIEIQQAIKNRLKEKGYTDAFSEGIMDELVAKLDDNRGILNWDNIFTQYRGRFRTSASADEVIDRLRAGDMKLGERVAEVLEAEGQTLIDSPSDMKDWIKKVIATNGLQGIIFIWDEFTEFFTNNVPVTPLQELAHSTSDMPFYFFLITHRAIQQFTLIDDETRRKLTERFHNCRLEMTPVTAYKLIGNVIESKSDPGNDWETKRDSLWNQVDAAALHINILGESVRKEELKLLPPIHPFTAYLLATISSLYSSNQRTFFRFLKEKEPGSFQWFVANFPHGGWYWLTPDYLWQYFFEEIKVEDIEGVSDILSHYNAVKDQLNENQMRVFRVMMLLTTLQQQMGDSHSHALLKPRLSIIKRMFLGTTLHNQVEEITGELCLQNIMLAVSVGDDREYIIPRVIIDKEKMEQYKQRAKASLTMEKMIDPDKKDAEFAPRLKEILLLEGAATLRHPVQIVSGKQLKYRRQRIIRGGTKPYEIGIVFVVAEEDEHLIGTEAIAKEITLEYPHYCILINQRAFGSKCWSEWIEFKAKSWYYEEMRDSNMKKYYDTRAKGIVTEWLKTIRISQIRAFFRGKQEQLVDCQAITNYLIDLVEEIFPDGPEKIERTATLYTSSWGKAGADAGLQITSSIHRPYSNVVEKLKDIGIWESGNFEHCGGHPVAKMKRKIDSIFAEQDSVNISTLWTAMQKPPYGLMPSAIGILLFSFLLKEYSSGYYYFDGINSLALNPHKLSELILDVLKERGTFEAYDIRKMSTEGEYFCRMAREAFLLTPEETAYPEEARKNMINAVIEIGYPLWAINYCTGEMPYRHRGKDIKNAVNLLSDILVYDRLELDDVEMKAIVNAIGFENHLIRHYLNKGEMRNGMQNFWDLHSPNLRGIASNLGLGPTEIMARLRLLLNEDVNMWNENRVKDRLPILFKELDIVHAMNILCQTKKQDLNTIRDYFRNTWYNSKLPLLYHREGQKDEIVELIEYIHELVYHTQNTPLENKAENIRSMKQQLLTALKINAPVIKTLVEKFTGQSINEEEAIKLYNSLPNLSTAEENDIRDAILNCLSQQERQKKIAILKKKWREYTDSESPTDWSKKMQTPIQWVLQGHAHHTFFLQYSKIQHLSEHEIDEAITHLEVHSSELVTLRDQQYILKQFIKIAAGDYASLIRQSNNERTVRDYVFQTIKGDVHEWPHRLGEITQKIRQWVHDNYRSSAYPKLLQVVECMSPGDMKDFIVELVSKDALVGVRLLAAIEGKEQTR